MGEIVLDVPPEVEARLEAQARAQGRDVVQIARQVLARYASGPPRCPSPRICPPRRKQPGRNAWTGF